MTPTQHLVAACAVIVVLTFVVALRMLRVRVNEMMTRRIGPQALALSGQRVKRLEDSLQGGLMHVSDLVTRGAG